MDSKEIEYCSCEKINNWEISVDKIPVHIMCMKPVKYRFPELKVDTGVHDNRKQNPYDFADPIGKTGRDVVYRYYYKGYSTSEIAQSLSLDEERVINFINALSIDPNMQGKYDYKTVLRSGVLSSGMQSFAKRDAMSIHEEDYAENVPKSFLRIGWACPDGY